MMAASPRLEAALRAVPNIVPGNFFAEVPDTMEPQRRAIKAIVAAVLRHDRDVAAARMTALATAHEQPGRRATADPRRDRVVDDSLSRGSRPVKR